MMTSELLNPESQPAAGSHMDGAPTCYVETAPLIDVMFEQLEYLVTHRSAGCQPGCAECARLAQVQG